MKLPCRAGAPAIDYPCYQPADEYILYGCLNMHITEIPLCAEHAVKWLTVQQRYKHSCPNCELFIEDWTSIQVTIINIGT